MAEVAWPDGFERTPPEEREPYPHNFRVDRERAFRNVLTQLDRLGAGKVMIDSGAVHRTDEPNVPYPDTEPDDPAVVAYFMMDGDDYAVPCDRWDSVRDNAQAIAKYLEAKRALERYGVETIRSELSTQALPSGDEDTEDPPAHEVLGVAPDADEAAVAEAARELKKEHHPDTGGDYEEFKRVLRAEEELLEG